MKPITLHLKSYEGTIRSTDHSPRETNTTPDEGRRGGVSSQWQDLVGRFCVSYNNSTIPKYQITEKRMAMKLSPILKAEGIGYLEYFYDECAKKDNFGRWFNWSLNSRNVK